MLVARGLPTLLPRAFTRLRTFTGYRAPVTHVCGYYAHVYSLDCTRWLRVYGLVVTHTFTRFGFCHCQLRLRFCRTHTRHTDLRLQLRTRFPLCGYHTFTGGPRTLPTFAFTTRRAVTLRTALCYARTVHTVDFTDYATFTFTLITTHWIGYGYGLVDFTLVCTHPHHVTARYVVWTAHGYHTFTFERLHTLGTPSCYALRVDFVDYVDCRRVD